MAISLTRVTLATDTVSDLVTAMNNNSGTLETAVNGIPEYGVVTNGGLSKSGNDFQMVNTGTAGTYGPTANVTGSNGATIKVPQITTDAKGRVTAVTERTLTCQNTNTTYSAGTGISLAGTTFSLGTTGTAGTYGPSANVTGSNGATIKVPQITTDSYGRVTSVSERTLTCQNTNTTYSAGNGLSLNGTTFSMSGSYSGNFTATKVYNAVWNDYAECREAEVTGGGWCVREREDGIMKLSTGRLQAGCRLTSDTFGSLMGETDKAKTPIAVAGRVLVRPSNRHKRSKWKIGKAVCSSYCGTVDVMSRLECILFPDRIIGYVSEIPTYEVWECGDKEHPQQVFVDERVWVYVR